MYCLGHSYTKDANEHLTKECQTVTSEHESQEQLLEGRVIYRRNKQWTNPSVLALAGKSDPVDTITKRAKAEVLRAVQDGWEGPPFDPFKLAGLLGIPVVPRDDVLDARTIPVGSRRFRIEFNPNKPRGRLRFSIAHEIAHTLFPDCAETVHNRQHMVAMREDDWQLELLCNIGAAEFLMPVGTEIDSETPVTIDNIIRLQRQFDVSTEAVTIRLIKVAKEPCAMFAAARVPEEADVATYVIDYSIMSRSSSLDIPQGTEIRGTTLPQCTAVGYTAKGEQTGIDNLPSLNLECVGIPPYPGQRFPRVIAIARSKRAKPTRIASLTHLRGDALEPRGTGRCIIAHVVNDKTPNWGAGFGHAVKRKYPSVQKEFREWATFNPANLALGNIYVSTVSKDLAIVQMIAQRSYGESARPRIRYQALENCLEKLKGVAVDQRASVHMPRIGTGYAGGNWGYIMELIDEFLVKPGIEVTIYTLPDYEPTLEEQGVLGFGVLVNAEP